MKERRRRQVAVHRDDVRGRDGTNAGESGDAGVNLRVEVLDRNAGLVARAREREPNREDL